MGVRITTIVVLVCCALLVLTQLYAAIPLASSADATFDTKRAEVALGTAFGASYAFGFLVFGPLSDRYGRRRVLVAGLTVATVATVVVAVAPTLVVLAASRAVQGLASASFSAVALAYVTESFPPRWAAATLGAVSTAYLVAGIAGQVYADLIAWTLGWRWVFGISAVALAMIVVALAVVLREPSRQRGSAGAASMREQMLRIRHLVTRSEFSLLCAGTLPVLMCFVAMYASLGDTSTVEVARLAGLPAMAVAPFAGLAGNRYGMARFVIVGLGAGAAGMVVQALASSENWVVVGSALVVAGVATAGPNNIALCGARAGDARASGIALNGCVLFVGASLGQPLAALPVGRVPLLLILAGLLLTAASLVWASGRMGPVRTPMFNRGGDR